GGENNGRGKGPIEKRPCRPPAVHGPAKAQLHERPKRRCEDKPEGWICPHLMPRRKRPRQPRSGEADGGNRRHSCGPIGGLPHQNNGGYYDSQKRNGGNFSHGVPAAAEAVT